MEFATWILALAGAVLYFTRSRRAPETNKKFIERLFWISAGVFVLSALLMTWMQYATWKGDALSMKLLPPYQSILYFVKYVGIHFWLAPIISVLVSAAFYGILLLLKRRNERFFEEGEPELGALAAFLVGWPRFVV